MPTYGDAPPEPKPFTGRRAELEAFADAMRRIRDTPKGNGVAVLHYHGVGGIGKTALQRKLRDHYTEVKFARLDLEISDYRSNGPAALRALASALNRELVPTPLFVLAHAHYLKLSQPDLAIDRPFAAFNEQLDRFTTAVEFVEAVPILEYGPKIVKAAAALYKNHRETIAKRTTAALKAFIDATELGDLGPVAEHLTVLLALDINNYVSGLASGVPLVIQLDALEAVRQSQAITGRGTQHSDLYLAQLCHYLEGVLVVTSGRDRLDWADPAVDALYPRHLEQKHIGGLSPADAREFLRGTGMKDDAFIDRVAGDSEGLPLYLNLAVDVHRTSSGNSTDELSVTSFPRSLAGLLERFQKYLSPTERQVLKVVAGLVRPTVEFAREVLTKLGHRAADLDFLLEYSFVDTEEDSVRIHNVLHATLTASIGIAEIRTTRLAALTVCDTLIESNRTRYDTGETLRYALSARVDYMIALTTSADEIVIWFDAQRAWLRTRGRGYVCILAQSQVLGFCSAEYGDEAPSTKIQKLHMAICLADGGRYTEAIPLFDEVLTWIEETAGSDHPSTTSILNEFVLCLREGGQLEEALDRSRQVLDNCTRGAGPDHLDTLAAISNLAGCLGAVGRHEEARPKLAQVLEVRERTLGPEHAETLAAAHNLGACLAALKRYREGLPFCKRALEGRERLLATDHPQILESVNAVASCLGGLGRHGEAQEYHRRAFAGREATFGIEHPRTLTSMNNLASCLKELGQYGDALFLHERSLIIHDRVYGPDDSRSLKVAYWTSHCSGHLGDSERTITLQKRIVETLQRSRGSDDPGTLKMMIELAGCHLRFGQANRSLPLLEEVLAARVRTLGADHALIRMTLELLLAVKMKASLRR